MLMKNSEIYTHTKNLMEAFNDANQKLPVKINFYLQKNRNTLLELAQDIEKARLEIAQSYGELTEDGEQYSIPPEKMGSVTKELEDLFNLEKEVNIYKINIDSLSDDLVMTTAQMEAIMFMID